MKTIDAINKTREYLDYIEEHIHNVNRAWGVLKDKCKDMRFMWDDFYYFAIQDAVDCHDMSKLSEDEFVQYRKHFYPVDGELTTSSLGNAWEHHKENNWHHWEKWTKEETWNPNEWEIHCVHMVIDWMAMGFKFGDTAQMYYEKNKDKINIPDYAVSFIYDIFKRVEDIK